MAAETGAGITWEKDILPVLEVHCLKCHSGPDAKNDLRLDTVTGLLKGGESGEPVLIPGDAGSSQIIRRLTSSDPHLQMPPKGERLPAVSVDLLKTWITAGAAMPGGDEARAALAAAARDEKITTDHWSFQPVARPADPVTADPWARGSIDGFILKSLRTKALTPSPEAGRRTLIRRLFLVMHGLPPTPAEVKSFVNDPTPDAWSRRVEQVLASPHYGGRWARHWLDVVRYADSNGYETNRERKTAWPYRDYVIDAFNQDKPYDQFIREQLAGDALGVDAATGFLVAGPYDLVKSPDINLSLMQREDELADMVNTTGTAFLGLTMGCARCHNHKFDPILQKDYYSMQAVFAGVTHGERPLRKTPDDSSKTELAVLHANITRWEKDLAAYRQQAEQARLASAGGTLRPPVNVNPDTDAWMEHLTSEQASQAHQAQVRLAAGRQRLTQLSGGAPAWLGVFSQPGTTHRLYRGDPLQKREAVAPDALTVLGSLGLSMDEPEQKRRLRLAEWITQPGNPLTARVMVNRVWHYIFGHGLADTPSDLGLNGSRPSHPELLDWLADEFVRSGWSVKHLQRLILLSATFQQSSLPRAEALSVDSDARMLWRYPPRRLEAEAIRDSMLAVSGALNPAAGGPGFYLMDVEEENVMHYHVKEKFTPAEFRRMVYQTRIRQTNDGVFGSFDCPDGSHVMPRRSRSNTALQALNLFNSPFVLQQAGLLAERLQNEAGAAPASQVETAFGLFYGRPPDDFERAQSTALILSEGLPAFCRALYNTSEFLFVF